jgi:hypothetical protein
MDEKYIHSSHIIVHAWDDGTNADLFMLVSKGQIAVVVHVGSETGLNFKCFADV